MQPMGASAAYRATVGRAITSALGQLCRTARLSRRRNVLDFHCMPAHAAAMRKRVQIALTVLLVALGGVIAWQVLHPREREPVYQGKGLRVWLAENYYAWARRDGQAQDVAESGIGRIGTNAIPTLLDMLRRKDSFLVSILIPIWDRHITGIPYIPAGVRFPSWYRTKAAVLNLQALKGFEVLRAHAQPAAPELIEIYEQNISPDSQFCASRALIAIGPKAARAAIPSFIRGAGSSEPRVREHAVFALSEAHAEPSLVVPALVKALSDTNANIRGTAAIGLREIGWSGGARAAVPALVPLLSDPDGQVRRVAAEALKQIDYDAAVKAGVK
jgi:hypothetical protein